MYRRISMPNYDFKKVACYFIEIALRYGCYPVNLLHIFRAPFYNSKNISLINLTPWIYNEIHLFIILIIKSFIRKKEDRFEVQTAWWEIMILISILNHVKVWFVSIRDHGTHQPHQVFPQYQIMMVWNKILMALIL